MRSRMIAFCCGVAAVSRFPDLPAIHAPWLIVLAVPLCVTWWRGPAPMAIAAALLLGLGWAVGVGNAHVAALLPGDLEGEDFWVIGEVRGLPQTSARSQQFTFQVEQSCFTLLPEDCHRQSPELAARFNDRKILLNHYSDADMIPDQRWLLRVRLNQPHGFANPGGFDYEGWLFQQGFTAKGYVRENPFNARLDDRSQLLELPSISLMRYHLRARLLVAMRELPHASIILALVLGDQEQISAESWSLFTATGTNHLIVISGMHVAFIALLCYGLSNWLARLSPWLLLRIPAQKCGAVSAVLGAFVYCLLAGFSVPTQRSCIMVLVFMSGQLVGRQFPPSFSFCLALTLVLLINPLSVTGAGFWLSFGAVGTLLLAFGGIRRLRGASHRRSKKGDEFGSVDDDERPRWDGRRLWQQHVQPQYVVFIGMIVPLAIMMQQLSLLSPLANVLAIPLVNILVVPPALLGTLLLLIHAPLGTLLLTLANHVLGVVIWMLQKLTSHASGLVLWQFFGLTTASLVFACAGSLLLLMPRGWPSRWLALVMFLPLLFPQRQLLKDGVAELTVLDVGQGLAVVVQTATHVLVYDTGPRLSESFDTGSAVVFPFLRQGGLRRVDRLIVSHADNDHAGGLESVLKLLEVESIAGSTWPEESDKLANFALCERGERWVWDGVIFEILHPPGGMSYAGNDSSCVLRIEAAEQSVLLPGDIEVGAERHLLQLQGTALASDVLIAPHHGSRTSSSERFLEVVRPSVVLYSAGYRSQFGHPASAVVARYNALGAVPYNTALSGALSLRLGEVSGPMVPTEFRSSHRRYWFTRPTQESARLHGVDSPRLEVVKSRSRGGD
ncbi:MAG: DNA internalization-related competence protein ComEC/Rec2 [Gammaproteobacteria bacterium]|nr:DNA internalization-related competence protein ComEC/Rec2 [Gammaproteobacteria bacterium]